jgi:hypothetical protein
MSSTSAGRPVQNEAERDIIATEAYVVQVDRLLTQMQETCEWVAANSLSRVDALDEKFDALARTFARLLDERESSA